MKVYLTGIKMKNHIDILKKDILNAWNLDSFIILLLEGNHGYKENNWRKVILEVIMPKFKSNKHLNLGQKLLLAEEINRKWGIEEYLNNRKFLNFLDNEVSIEDF